jgi:hypothetical protein
VKAATAATALLPLALALLPAASAQEAGGPPLTVLIFHPDDGVDPLGVPYAGSDPFAVRYGALVAHKGRFDFPFFVADGVLPIETIPDPAQPYASALAAYDAAVAARSAEQAPARIALASVRAGGQAVVSVGLDPVEPLPGEGLHLWVAVVEDHVHYQPPPGLTNGVTDHRFTVRAVADLGVQDLSGPANATHTFELADGWRADQLSVAAWLQQDAPSPRFDAREVVQATHAPLGGRALQETKGVLAEMLSATWCDPCLYGDKAMEDLAVARGVARPGGLEPESRYLDLGPGDLAPIAAAGLAGVLLVAAARWPAGRGRP